jgi:hypothetical protein
VHKRKKKMKNIKSLEEFNSIAEDKKITMNNLDWGKSTAERNANLDKYNSLKTDKEKDAFLKKLKGESIVSEAKELAWIDKGDPEKEVRVTDNDGYVTIMQKEFGGNVVRVIINSDQIPELIAALKRAK